MTQAEAYLTHYILEGNTDPERNLLWGERAQLSTPDGQRRPAGFKTGTTNDFRDVSGFGYVPGSLTTGVWMGNNNQEPMSNEFSGGLFSADGPLFLWHEFMDLALNQPWDWNEQTPGRPDELPRARGDRERRGLPLDRHVRDQRLRHARSRCRSSRARSRRSTTSTARLPRPRAVRGPGSERPEQLDRRRRHVVRPRSSTARPGRAATPPSTRTTSNVRFAIAPLYGESGFPAVCGERVARPREPDPPSRPERRARPAVATTAAAAAAEAAAAAAAEAAEAAATAT